MKRFLAVGGDETYFSGGVDSDHSKVIQRTSLDDDCNNAWACVVHNTSASTTPIINGIPVFTSETTCPVYKVANHSYKDLENPKLIDRTQWLNDTAYSLWHYDEIRTGALWRRFRARLNDKGEISKAKTDFILKLRQKKK